MRQDRRILGYIGIALSLLCCLPVFCLSGLTVFAGSMTAVNPTHSWGTDDTTTAAIFVVILILSALGGLVLAGFGLWSIFSAVNAPRE